MEYAKSLVKAAKHEKRVRISAAIGKVVVRWINQVMKGIVTMLPIWRCLKLIDGVS